MLSGLKDHFFFFDYFLAFYIITRNLYRLLASLLLCSKIVLFMFVLVHWEESVQTVEVYSERIQHSLGVSYSMECAHSWTHVAALLYSSITRSCYRKFLFWSKGAFEFQCNCRRWGRISREMGWLLFWDWFLEYKPFVMSIYNLNYLLSNLFKPFYKINTKFY